MAIIVTMTGETFKRYQVCEEDEYLFARHKVEDTLFFFGAQAIRRNGIDEQYRALCSRNVTKVTRK